MFIGHLLEVSIIVEWICFRIIHHVRGLFLFMALTFFDNLW